MPDLDDHLDDLGRRLLALDPQERARIAEQLGEGGIGTSLFPVTSGQAAILFLEQLHPDNPGYLIPTVVDVRGPLDLGALRDAVDRVVLRHETLRTAFAVQDGTPVQRVHRFLSVPLPVTDLTGAGDADVEAAVEAELRTPLDLARGPLLRMRLLRRSATEHLLLVTMHHLVTDGWSMGLFVTELTEAYRARLEHRAPRLAALPVQYGDYAIWERRQDSTPARADGLAYRREHLRGAPAALTLPSALDRPPVQGFRGASVPFALPADVLARLTDLGREHGATPYMVLLALFQTVLHRAGGQDDVVVGVPVAGRQRAEVEPLIGFFVNTVPVRARFAAGQTLGEVLHQVRDACRGAYAHEDVPVNQIVDDVRPPRDLSRTPVFQTCFSYQAAPFPRTAVGDLTLQLVPRPAVGARFDLEIQSFGADGAVHGWFEFDRDVLDEGSVRRLARQFERLAAAAPGCVGTPVSRLPLLSDDERREVLAASTGPVRRWDEGWVPDVISARAQACPDVEALRYEGTSMTYRELAATVNRLAHRLGELGVGPGTMVAVSLERSVELVVALLAVLRAGGAFQPVEPGLPAARARAMLAGVLGVIARTPGPDTVPDPESVPDPGGPPVWDVEELLARSASRPATPPRPSLHADDPAYVVHTSGSTGAPKGVVNTHGGIRNRLLWMQDAYPIGPGDRVLQKTPTSFDVAVWEFLWPFMTGATLVVLPPDAHKDPQVLAATVAREGITTMHFVPSMLRLFVQQPGAAACTGLRRVICSGEALPRDLADAFLALGIGELHNLYGPAEAAIDVTAWPCRTDDPPGPVPIGRPIANTQVYVLDEARQPVPPGVVGELYLGGDNIALGYAGRPDLTAERFVDDHLAAPGASATGRLYRTGDLGRMRSDGALDFLGRTDHQIKLRGQRIELGEIETVLLEHPGVREAVVVPHPRSADDVRLVGYLRVAGDVATADVAAAARARLPEHMVPSGWVVLDTFPLSANGKCDRAALPAPQDWRSPAAAPYVPAADDVEATVARVWQEVLGIDRVGTQDAFFDLGGHSLLLVVVRDRLAAELGQELALVELLQYPTVAALAAHLRRRSGWDAAGAGRERAEARRRARAARQSPARRATAGNGRS